jgi:hypothetical protein
VFSQNRIRLIRIRRIWLAVTSSAFVDPTPDCPAIHLLKPGMNGTDGQVAAMSCSADPGYGFSFEIGKAL